MIVEDDRTLRTVLGDYLRTSGFEVTEYADGPSARLGFESGPPDVVVLDRMLPGLSGDELCRHIRGLGSDVPIIMLTALDSTEDRIDGLEHGADDYVPKPFALREVQLRIASILRRSAAAQAVSTPFTVGRFRVDPARRRVWIGAREVVLTGREYELFLFLSRNPDRVITRDEIMSDAWGWSFGDASTVTVHVRRLREKIECDPRSPDFLVTEWGLGYSFAPSAEIPC
ncbi:response regulator [Rathayibacter sp. VKM Ac-2760]|nr:response regulator [Rathayibacter sp. VKM Ac-2760]